MAGPHSTGIEHLVAGPGVLICNECVALCTELFASRRPPGVPEVPYWQQMDDDQLLAQLPRIAAVATQVEDNLGIWIRRARDRGISWARIGQAIGMTRQSAWERFADGAGR